jgi:hypothetical protein
MSMHVESAHEILEANFDRASTDEQRLEFARIVDARPKIVEEAFTHSLLQWSIVRPSLVMAPPDPIVASEINDMGLDV